MGKRLTVKDYASLKNISESSVKNHIRDKKIEAVQVDGKYFIIVKDTRRIIPQQEKALRLEIKLLKKENKILNQLRTERDDALVENKELRSKVEELHNKIHELNSDNQTLYKDVYGELKSLRITAKPHIVDED